MLEARGLSKRYGGFLALDRVDFHVRRGEILGYLGPNGSGKSTTVNTVVGLIDPSAGSFWIDGSHLDDPRLQTADRICPGRTPSLHASHRHGYLMLVGRLRDLSERTLASRVPELLRLFCCGTAATRPWRPTRKACVNGCCLRPR